MSADRLAIILEYHGLAPDSFTGGARIVAEVQMLSMLLNLQFECVDGKGIKWLTIHNADPDDPHTRTRDIEGVIHLLLDRAKDYGAVVFEVNV